MFRATLLTGMTLVAGFGLSIAWASPAAAAVTHHVTLSNFTYCVEGDCNNHTLTISPGDTVVWTYADSACDLALASCLGHTATSTGGPSAFNSPRLHIPGVISGNTPTTYAFSFSSPGTYTYTCSFHGSAASHGLLHMDGAIVVQAAASQGILSSLPAPLRAAAPLRPLGSLPAAPLGTLPGLSASPANPGTSNPGTSSKAAGVLNELPVGVSLFVPAEQLPNIFLPSLPGTGRAVPLHLPKWWVLLALVTALLSVPAALLINRFSSPAD